MSVAIVAFYGAGMLGSAMVRAMLERGIAVRVWNRTPERAAALEAYGAEPFEDPAEAADGAEFVHLCLSDDASVDGVLDAALPGVPKASPIIDHTTVLPQRVVERALRLDDGEHAFLHAPVFMGPPMALQAHGVMMTSGDAALFERVRPHLQGMCSDLRYVGGRSEDAAIFKLMGNAMILAVVGGLNDAMRIGEEQGLTREQAYTLFDFFDPSGQIKGRGKRMADGTYEPYWTLDMAHKDATLMQAAAHYERLPVIDAVEALMRNVSDRGLGNLDVGAVAARSASV
ncbi:MAG: NAD(P)-dependent oxidoreductase [Candidatus Eremiobacteraeota bacterium]|nr:NAD(P)-dependent oxidoreductase [Candidatus Eremiobacteraeota bacterium]